MEQDAPEIEPRPILAGYFPEELAEKFGLKPYQGRQLFRWIHQKQVFDFDAMSDLSKPLRQMLADCADVTGLRPATLARSAKSSTRKVLFRLCDGETVESVYLRDRERVTLCISTQVGCAVKCSFCATGLSGFARNLSPGEIGGQALHVLREEPLGDRTPNIVFMGMGEPFRNYDATVKALRLLGHPDGLHIGARKMTVSTAGEVPGIEKFAHEGLQVRLSVSLHAANDALRDELVPLNRKYNLFRLMEAVRHYQETSGRQITFEWTLLEGVNDSTKDADELADLCRGLDAFVNLIPYNPVQGLGYKPPARRVCEAFRDRLIARGIKATLRVERGQDIDAACGQLRRRTA